MFFYKNIFINIYIIFKIYKLKKIILYNYNYLSTFLIFIKLSKLEEYLFLKF